MRGRISIRLSCLLEIDYIKETLMGRTLPSTTHIFYEELKSLGSFRRGLSRNDQLVLDELFSFARQHLAPAAYAAYMLPIEIFLLAMLLEKRKEVMRLRELVSVALGDRQCG